MTRFEINATSYNANPTTATDNVGDANPEEIINKKVTIPQTGGIGTIIFTVVGIALMAGAVMAMRKRNSEEI
ncbi:LPXTG-motif cell wall anchor domain-containing protein [Peptoniphilus asaccharolyticus DSM 20463]|uniref:LPXTG-motif cell wall anchor domain-containing protein n=1 Tax=Peptoniphilus asaccharolyticus DSM 20463 TaxID=573058 RepID=A0A1W1VIP3_PEPAS|nr:LPXTG cell wall anchor domain-containing protein [Peptoniphilus asaccharolyticus]MBL7574359.1 LPXTG cell wall anchor domain-containing protein [Peptoniphilus asaccharolyticus]SMB93196.1 LPXTG-motif cell wall anchor domain-containing protein [Peptoniphilus asaccharolyticus DSM 20463]